MEHRNLIAEVLVDRCGGMALMNTAAAYQESPEGIAKYKAEAEIRRREERKRQRAQAIVNMAETLVVQNIDPTTALNTACEFFDLCEKYVAATTETSEA